MHTIQPARLKPGRLDRMHRPFILWPLPGVPGATAAVVPVLHGWLPVGPYS